MAVSVARLSTYSSAMIDLVKDRMADAPESHRRHIKDVLSAAVKEQEPTEALNIAHELQRLYWLAHIGGFNGTALTHVEKNKQTWKNYKQIPLSQAQFAALADKFYHANAPEKAPVLILNDYTRGYGEALVHVAMTQGSPVGIHIGDEWGRSLAISQLRSEEDGEKLALAFRKPWAMFDRRLTLKSEYTSFSFEDFPYQKPYKNAFLRKSSSLDKENKDKLYTLTSMPCPQHAVLDGVPYVELCHYYYRMKMADEGIVAPAQDALAGALNKGSEIVIKNDHGTYLTMSIRGQNFAISNTKRNSPGSEVYGSPVLRSVNGVIRSPERYVHKGKMIEGLYMELRDGIVTKYEAKSGYDVLQAILEADYINGVAAGIAAETGTPGSKGIGELGFGTAIDGPNWQSSLNIMGEKRIGVHVATGRAYTDTFYGTSVDNGNRGSQPHKDWTLNMIDTKGAIIIDGVPIMEKGLYVLPGTEILNQGRKGLSL